MVRNNRRTCNVRERTVRKYSECNATQIQKIGIALSSIGHRVTLLQAVSTDRGALSLLMFINSIVILFLVIVFRDLPL